MAALGRIGDVSLFSSNLQKPSIDIVSWCFYTIAVLNVGTSCQMSFLSKYSSGCEEFEHLQTWPYKGSQHLSVVASMNGGNVLASFVIMLQGWLHELGEYGSYKWTSMCSKQLCTFPTIPGFLNNINYLVQNLQTTE